MRVDTAVQPQTDTKEDLEVSLFSYITQRIGATEADGSLSLISTTADQHFCNIELNGLSFRLAVPVEDYEASL